MSLMSLTSKQQSPFYKLGTLRDMSAMVTSLVMAKKMMEVVAETEDYMLSKRKTITVDQFNKAVQMMLDYASSGAKHVGEAIDLLVEIRRKIREYKKGF